jgi:hypothetical protein
MKLLRAQRRAVGRRGERRERALRGGTANRDQGRRRDLDGIQELLGDVIRWSGGQGLGGQGGNDERNNDDVDGSASKKVRQN